MLVDNDNSPHNSDENFKNNVKSDEALIMENDEPQLEQQHEQQDINPDKTKIKELEQEIVALKDQHLRALAENENVRKRAERERQDALRFAICSFAIDLLPFCDNFDRALISMKQQNTSEMKSLIEGIEIIEKELMKVFEKHQVKKLYPLHEIFDPKLHQAMFEVSNDQHPAGTITEVLQAGYILNERLLRPAMVGVVKIKA